MRANGDGLGAEGEGGGQQQISTTGEQGVGVVVERGVICHVLRQVVNGLQARGHRSNL